MTLQGEPGAKPPYSDASVSVPVTEEGRSWTLDGYIEHDGHEWWRIAEGPRVSVDGEPVEVVESSKLRAVEAELGRLREGLPTDEEQAHLYSMHEAAIGRAQKADRECRQSGGRFPPEFIVKALFDDAALLLTLADRAAAALASSPGASDWQCQVCGALESKGGCGHDFELHYAEVSSPGREGRDGGTDEG